MRTDGTFPQNFLKWCAPTPNPGLARCSALPSRRLPSKQPFLSPMPTDLHITMKDISKGHQSQPSPLPLIVFIEFMALSSNFLFCCLLPPSRWWDYRGAPTCHFVCACAHVCTDAGTCTWRSEDNLGCCSLKCFCWSLTWNPPGWPTCMDCM